MLYNVAGFHFNAITLNQKYNLNFTYFTEVFAAQHKNLHSVFRRIYRSITLPHFQQNKPIKESQIVQHEQK